MEKILSEDYCSFELSKLLEEKGFDEDTERVYERNIMACRYEDYPMPTHQMAMKWLREKDIDIIIMPLFKLKGGRIYCYEIHSDAEDIRTGQFETYEEAVEVALKYVLENLI